MAHISAHSPAGRFRHYMGRLPQRIRPFGVEPKREKPLDQAAMKHYWNPDRYGVEQAPAHVRKEIAKIHPDLRVVKPAAGAPMDVKPWIVWFRNPDVKHPLCPGWSLVFVWEFFDTKEPKPLDNRLYANIYAVDGRRFGNALKYFNGCVDSVLHERKKAKAQSQELTQKMSADVEEYRKIKNIGKGNKFALHHDGTLIPSQGEFLWRQQTLYDRLPDKVRRDDEERHGKNTRKRVSNSRAAGEIGANAAADRDFRLQLDTLKFLRDRRERVGRRLSRSSVGFTR
jgi:hypothetical protein